MTEEKHDEIETASPSDLALFTLEMVNQRIDDIWTVIYGASQPRPTSPSRALGRVLAKCMGVDWTPESHTRELPMGLVPDDATDLRQQADADVEVALVRQLAAERAEDDMFTASHDDGTGETP